MNLLQKQFLALVGAGALTSVSLLASVAPAQKTGASQERFVGEIESILSMSPAQKDQAQTAIDKARDSAKPIEQQLSNTNSALQAAVRSGNQAEIERLASNEGHEIGQLVAIRSSAVAQVYKTLTPDQKSRADALHNVLMRNFRQEMTHSRDSRIGS